MTALTDKRIGLVCIATGKYKKFVEPFTRSVSTYFFKDNPVTAFLFTDKPNYAIPVVNIQIDYVGFPDVTLLRYNMFHKYKDLIISMVDYVFYSDIDMLFVDTVGPEILPERQDEIVVVKHPGYWRGGGTWETRSESMAYVAPENRKEYFAGGFLGAETFDFFEMCKKIGNNVMKDKNRKIAAIWDDESHLQAYVVDKPKKVLSPSYCYPELEENPPEWKIAVRENFKPIIIALNKDHAQMRS
jgi:hypothetical protein